jgi:acetate kinase
MYPLPYELYEQNGIRKYGFHGTSHRYVSSVASEMMGKDLKDIKVITCHLGNGASLCAVKEGKSVETSMGFTPLAGLAMGTRCGDIDPAILLFMERELNMSPDEVDNVINKKSGVLGISGVSSDFRDIEGAAKEGNKRAKLALDVYHYTVRQTIGAYTAVLNGVDAIVFTAGLGENSAASREEILNGLEYLGIKIDAEKNKQRGKQIEISTADSKVKVFVIPTDEELMIARDTKEITSK